MDTVDLNTHLDKESPMNSQEKIIKNTADIDEILGNVSSISQLEDYLGHNAIPEFDSIGEYLEFMLTKKGLEKAQVIKDSDIQRNYGYQIFSGVKQPGRNKLIALALAMGLNLEEVQRALSIAKEGKLYSKDKRDSILIYSINKKQTVLDTNNLLFEMGEELL